MPHILHNGQLLPESSGVPIRNRGFLFADGIFETIRIAHGRPLFLDDHHKRIREGLKAHRIHAPLGFTPASIEQDIRTLPDAEGITGMSCPPQPDAQWGWFLHTRGQRLM